MYSISFETLGDFHADALEVLARIQGRVNLAALVHDVGMVFCYPASF